MRGSTIYYGWFVLTASAISEMLVQGATAYSAGLFVLPLQNEFHISRAGANSSIQLLYLGIMLVAPFVGRMLDIRPIRLVMPLGALVLGLSLAGIALAPALWMMGLILLAPTAFAFMILGPLNTSTLATRWFFRHRGLALGLAAVATSGGGFTVVPLLSSAIELFGWRQALLYEAVVVGGIITALALLVLRDRPSDMGLEDHPENQGRGAVTIRRAVPWREVFASRAFWIPALTLSLISGTSQAVVITLVPYAVQLGVTPVSASFLISVFAIAAAITKILAGVLADHINQRNLLVIAAAAMTLSWLGLSFSAAYGGLFAGAALAGIALGCALPTAAGMIAGTFGSSSFGGVMAWVYTFTSGLAILAVYFVGFLYDRSGGYHAAFLSFSALLAGLTLMIIMAAPNWTRSLS